MVKVENASVLDRVARVANGVRQHHVDAAAILPWVIVGIVVGLVIVPLLAMVLMSFRPLNVLPLEWAGGFTLSWYPEVFLDPATYLLLWNTFKYAFGSGAGARPGDFGPVHPRSGPHLWHPLDSDLGVHDPLSLLQYTLDALCPIADRQESR